MNIINYLKQHWDANRDNIFIIDSFSGLSYTYADMLIQAIKLSSVLRANGITKGDRIAVLMNNCIELAQLYFAAMYMGSVVVPVNPVLGLELAKHIITDSGAKLLITDTEIEYAAQLAEEASILFFNEIGKTKADDLVEQPPFHDVMETDEIIVVYTSGTTSKPKGVIHTYSSIFSNGISFAKIMNLNCENRFINILPMAYLGGYYNLLLIPFISGGSVVLSSAFQASSILNFWQPIIKYKVNTLWLVPTIIAMLMELDRGNDGINYCRDNKIFSLVGTAPLLVSVRNDFENKYNIKLYENYALSETFFITTIAPDMKERIGVGPLIQNVSVKILNNQGELVQHGEEGEIFVRTFSLMKGYQGEEMNSRSDERWFPTGDIGKILDSGNLVISGRKKDLIIKGGINISPAYIENVISENARVKECCVVGVPHKIMGEEIVCVIRIADDVQFDLVESELRQLISQKLPLIYRPTHIIQIPDFPVTPTGKIQKHKIRVWASEEIDKKNRGRKMHFKEKHNTSFFQPSHVVNNISQAMSIKYNNRVYDLQNQGEDVIVLSLGEAFFDIPLYPFDDLPFPKIYHYSHSRGIAELREKLSSYFLSHYEVEFDPKSEIIITAGSKVAIYMSLLAILNNGDEVLIYEPAWVSYPEQVRLCYGVPVMIPYDKNVFEFENYITNRTKVIIINNPNNPTGKIYSVEEFTYLTRLAERYGLFIISDEAYSDFVLEEERFLSLGNIDKEKKYSIICNSMSKNYGMSGWRVGYIISNETLINQILKINQHLITCPATILEYYLSKHFDDVLSVTKKQIKDVVKKRETVVQYLDKIGLNYMPGTSTFYIFVSIGNAKLKSEEFCDILLNEKHICVVPGIGYGQSCDGFVRVSIGTESLDRIFYALDEIRKLIYM